MRKELRRLFGWLKGHQLNAIITGEDWPRGSSSQFGLKEYVTDCVVVPDNRVYEQTITRRRQVVKYHSLAHGTDEYPFSTGISSLDATSHRRRFFQSFGILFSDEAGAVKTTIYSHFIDAAVRRGERSALFEFEEGSSDYCRTAMSVEIDLNKWIEADLVRLDVVCPNLYELERFNPSLIVIDPISTLFGTTEVCEIRLHQQTMPCSLAGSARLTQEARKQTTNRDQKNKIKRRQRQVFRQEEILVSQITILRIPLEQKEDEAAALLEQNVTRVEDFTTSNRVLSAYQATLQ